MKRITAKSSLEEVATIVSETLAEAGIPAVLGGGGAVTYYSDNRYMSTDLDFITVERNSVIAPVIAKLGSIVFEQTPIGVPTTDTSEAVGVRQCDLRLFCAAVPLNVAIADPEDDGFERLQLERRARRPAVHDEPGVSLAVQKVFENVTA